MSIRPAYQGVRNKIPRLTIKPKLDSTTRLKNCRNDKNSFSLVDWLMKFIISRLSKRSYDKRLVSPVI